MISMNEKSYYKKISPQDMFINYPLYRNQF